MIRHRDRGQCSLTDGASAASGRQNRQAEQPEQLRAGEHRLEVDRSSSATPAVSEASSQPQVRGRMLELIEFFLARAVELDGVQRIALIGSITRATREPKDLDLLVCVRGDMHLSELARLARRTRGRLQSINRGCDVFLTDPDNRYIGRLCIWTRCEPRIRASCDAQHCGQRAFLHDDFDDIRLARDVIIKPPVELWPELVVRRAIPQDLSLLLDHLSTRLPVANSSKSIPNGR